MLKVSTTPVSSGIQVDEQKYRSGPKNTSVSRSLPYLVCMLWPPPTKEVPLETRSHASVCSVVDRTPSDEVSAGSSKTV